MGTDIFMVCEIKKRNKWRPNRKKVFLGYNEFTETPYSHRNYDLFAILADVRNGYGFAGCYTGEPFNPIADCKGIPDDISKQALKHLFPDGYGASYYTLTELEAFDWQQMHKTFGYVSYDEYADTVAKGEMPSHWCGGVSGPNVKIISADKFPLKRRNKNTEYYVGGYFPAITYAECVGEFYTETLPALHSLIPKGGTSDDVRIVFNFDC